MAKKRMSSDDRMGIAVTLILVLGVIVVPVCILARLIVRGLESRSRPRDRAAGLPRREPAAATGNLMMVLVLVFFFAGVFFFLPRKPKHPGAPPPRAASAVPYLNYLLAAVGGSACLLIFLGIRNHDPVLSQSLKQFQAGDRDGAILTLRNAIDVRPTAIRANNLAVFLMAKENWIDAHKVLLLAKDLGLREDLYRTNLAWTLRSLGRPQDALAALEPHVLTNRAPLIEVCIYCETLLDLNRTQDALEQIGRAEKLFKTIPTGGAEQARRARSSIDALRDRFEQRSSKKPSVTVDEL